MSAQGQSDARTAELVAQLLAPLEDRVAALEKQLEDQGKADDKPPARSSRTKQTPSKGTTAGAGTASATGSAEG